MDTLLEPAISAFLDIMMEDAVTGLDTARRFRRADINNYTNGQVQYWEHAIGVIKWLKYRAKRMKSKSSTRGRRALQG